MDFDFGNDFSFSIDHISTCDFSLMQKIDNHTLLARSGQRQGARLERHINHTFGIESRFHCNLQQNSLDLARSALSRLLALNPDIATSADFFIFAGISNPFPATTLSSLLAQEFGFTKASCWDLKSGCSTGLLALLQGLLQIKAGASAGVIVCAENLSKFADPSVLQASMTLADGAAALFISNKKQWRVLSATHGTDSRGSHFMRVLTEFPYQQHSQSPYYQFADKPQAIQLLQKHWLESLDHLLKLAIITGNDIQHYIAHQIDTEKNLLIAKSQNIPNGSIAACFQHFGNMGCPTVFINLFNWMHSGKLFHTNDKLILQAVGGGVSWAGLCLEKH